MTKPDKYGRHPCGCVDTRDFKGYTVKQLCDAHLEIIARGIASRMDATERPSEGLKRLRDKHGKRADAQEHIDFLTGKRTHDE